MVTANESALQQDIIKIDPSVDVDFGPVYDLFIKPIASELTLQDTDIAKLKLLYSTQFVYAMTSEELEALAYSYGLTRLPGTKAAGTVTFMVTGIYSGQVINIPLGTQVSTSDGSYSFVTTASISMTQAEISTRYNPTTRAYEIDVPVEAVDFGEAFRVAPYTIVKIDSPLQVIAKVQNTAWTTGGSDVETDSALAARILERVQSTEKGTVNGLQNSVRNYSTQVSDVQAVPQTYAPAVKVYVIGGTRQSTTETFVGQRTVTLTSYVPVISILSVTLDGTTLQPSQYTLTENFNTFTVTITPTVTPTSILVVEYEYNDLVSAIQAQYLSIKSDLFGTNILVREAYAVELIVTCKVTLQAGIDINTTEMALRSTIMSLINTNTFVAYIYPVDIRRQIEQSVAGIASVTFTAFNRLDANNTELLSEVIEFNEGEYALLESSNLTITI